MWLLYISIGAPDWADAICSLTCPRLLRTRRCSWPRSGWLASHYQWFCYIQRNMGILMITGVHRRHQHSIWASKGTAYGASPKGIVITGAVSLVVVASATQTASAPPLPSPVSTIEFLHCAGVCLCHGFGAPCREDFDIEKSSFHTPRLMSLYKSHRVHNVKVLILNIGLNRSLNMPAMETGC